MDAARQALRGRSEMIEKGIDTAVERLGRYSERLGQQAEGWKEKVRQLDDERTGTSGGTSAGTSTDAGPGPLVAPDVGTTGPVTDAVSGTDDGTPPDVAPPDEGGPYPAV